MYVSYVCMYVCIYVYCVYIYILVYVHIYMILVCTYLYTCFMIICVKKNGQYICRCIHAHVFLVMQARKVNYTVAFWLIPGVFLNCSFNVCTQNIIWFQHRDTFDNIIDGSHGNLWWWLTTGVVAGAVCSPALGCSILGMAVHPSTRRQRVWVAYMLIWQLEMQVALFCTVFIYVPWIRCISMCSIVSMIFRYNMIQPQ